MDIVRRHHQPRSDVDIYRVHLNDGESLLVDIDRGTDPSDNVDTQAWIFDNIPNQGQAYSVTSNDDASALDQGSDSDLDPNLPFTADHSGNYYVAITAIGNDWAGQSGWSNTGSDAGDYTLKP